MPFTGVCNACEDVGKDKDNGRSGDGTSGSILCFYKIVYRGRHSSYRSCVYVCMCVCGYVGMWVCVCMCVCMYEFRALIKWCIGAGTRLIGPVCMCVCGYVGMWVCVCVYVCVCVCMNFVL